MNNIIKFVTGEKIQFLCNHYIGTQKDFAYNPNILKNHKNKCIDIVSINREFNNKKLIFCYTSALEKIDILISKLKFLKNPFVLIFHNSDTNFNYKDLILFEKLNLLEKIYTQNMNVIHPKVIPLPIGLPNSQWRHGDLNKFEKIYTSKIPKSNDIFFNFNISTSLQIRKECCDIIKQFDIPWINFKPYYEYLKCLKQYKYCICPEGNGIDTHRFWECLYLNVIPICKKNTLVEYYSKYFPIVILDNWNDLNIKDLLNNYNNYKFNNNLLDFNKIINIYLF